MSLESSFSAPVIHDSGVHSIAELPSEIVEPIFGTLQKAVIERAITLAFGRQPTLDEMDTLFINGSMERCSELFRELAESRLATGELNASHCNDEAVIQRFAAELAPLIPHSSNEQAA